MLGYAQGSFDADAREGNKRGTKARPWKTILATLAYVAPLFWLWSETDFPDSLGVHIAAHGKAGLAESWYYSYLLVERRHFLDIVTFAYMWSIGVVLLVWIAHKILRKANLGRPSDGPEIGVVATQNVEQSRVHSTLRAFAPSEWILFGGFGVVLLLGLGWALNAYLPSASDALTSEGTFRDECFNESQSYAQTVVTPACNRLIEDSNFAIHVNPDDAAAYFDRGFAYEHAGNLKRAIADFSQVILLEPDRTMAYYYRWAAYSELGDEQRAGRDFAVLNRRDPELAAQLRPHH